MKFEIRTATPGDRIQWGQLRLELWPDCPPDRHRLEMIQISNSPGIVALALVDRELAGFAEVSVRSDHVEGTVSAPVPYLEGWFVRPAVRGHGVGRALLSFVEQWAVSEGFCELASDAELSNGHSIRLHTMLGFREAGRSVHFVKTLKAKGAKTSATANRDSVR